MNHSICPYLASQFHLHPSMTPQDIAKLCYQAARGAEHLLSDLDRARGYLERELEATVADGDIPLVEPISDDVARVNMAAWKARGLSSELLFDLFAATASVRREGEDLLPVYLAQAGAWLADVRGPVDPAEWREFLLWYEAQGCPALHHSEAYRAAEKPAYRIVLRELLAAEGLA